MPGDDINMTEEMIVVLAHVTVRQMTPLDRAHPVNAQGRHILITSRLGDFGSVRGQSSCGGAQGGKPQVGPPCPRSPRPGALPRSSSSSIRRDGEHEPATTDSTISMKRSIEALKI
jgi:hypothetical protein